MITPWKCCNRSRCLQRRDSLWLWRKQKKSFVYLCVSVRPSVHQRQGFIFSFVFLCWQKDSWAAVKPDADYVRRVQGGGLCPLCVCVCVWACSCIGVMIPCWIVLRLEVGQAASLLSCCCRFILTAHSWLADPAGSHHHEPPPRMRRRMSLADADVCFFFNYSEDRIRVTTDSPSRHTTKWKLCLFL